jgi:hypothetical protein
MKTKNQLREEFPELKEAQLLTAYHYLEIVQNGKQSDEFRQLVADSLEPNGNLLKLSKRIEMPLPC